MMVTKVQKWGNSLAVRLPKATVKILGIREGTPVSVQHRGRKIIVEPETKTETLQDLLRRITPKNRHPAVKWGPDVGKEIVKW